MILNLIGKAMNKLHHFRKQIDDIDNKIITLLKERANIVLDVKKFKDKQAPGSFSLYIKPDREYETIRRVESERGAYPSGFYTNLWRTIISASNLIEQNLSFIASDFDAKFYTSRYFGNLKAVKVVPAQDAVAKIVQNDAHILGFVSSQKEVYEELRAHDSIKIFAAMKHENDGRYVFFCGKINNIEQYFAEGSYVITTQKTPDQLADGVYLKPADGTDQAFIFGRCFII